MEVRIFSEEAGRLGGNAWRKGTFGGKDGSD